MKNTPRTRYEKVLMKIILEIFYMRVVGERLRYQRKEVNLSRKGGDPDELIWSRIRQEHPEPHDEEEEHEFIVHSTSWRYERPGKIVLTYAAYSDELEFEKGKSRSIPLRSLGTIKQKPREPRSRAELQKKVVSHAMRHIAFLIQTDKQDEFEHAVNPKTSQVFKKIWVSLAGKVF